MHGNKLFITQHERIISAYLSGIKQKIISVQLGIPTNTVNDTIKRYKKTDSAIPDKRFRYSKLLIQCDIRTLQCIIYTDQFSPLGDVTNKLNFGLDMILHNSTVRRYLHNMNISSYSTYLKSLLTEK